MTHSCYTFSIVKDKRYKRNNQIILAVFSVLTSLHRPFFSFFFLLPACYWRLFFRQKFLYLLVAHLVVGKVASQVLVVRAHVHEPVSRKVEEDGTLLSFFLGLQCLTNSHGNRVGRLRRRDDTLGAGEKYPRLERFQLFHAHRFNQFVFQELAHDAARAVVAKPPGVNVGRCKLVSQRVHRYQGGVTGLVAKVVLELPAGKFGARRGFGCHEPAVFLPGYIMAQERERDAREIGASPEASDYHVGVVVRHFHLLFCLQPDDGLVQRHVIEHAAQGVLALGRLHGQLDRLGDGGTQAPLVIRIVGNNLAPRLRGHAGRGDHLCSPRLHQRAAIGFLLVTDFYHVDCQLQSESLRGKRQRGTPLTGPGLGSDVGDSLYLVVISLWKR